MSSSLLVILFTITIITVVASSEHHHYYSKEKTTHLHFYFHEIFSGSNATAQIVVKSLTNTSHFGQIGVIDDMLRLGPETNSKLIGRAEGLAVSDSLQGFNVLTAVNFVFTAGEYNGSTLAIFGRLEVGATTIERSIIGGSGKFRLARGYVIFKVFSSSPPPGMAIFEADAEVVHY